MIKVDVGQYYVVFAETNTGIVVNLDGTRNLSENIPHIVFDNFEDAKNFSRQKLSELSRIECNIYNDEGKFIEVVGRNQI